MITRYALFEGQMAEGKQDSFRKAMLAELLPKWQAFPGALAVRVSFTVECDPDAPEFPLILAISYPDLAAASAALSSPVRAESRVATESVLAGYFTGCVHHHVTDATDALP